MDGRLGEDEKRQLQNWIGRGPKTFTLLYAITRDRCHPAFFHEKCDGQGPTVTVLYNPQGSVYGGYASASWRSLPARHVSAPGSFLFQLKYNGAITLNKFELKPDEHEYSVFHSPAYGPTFGRGHSNDLRTFIATIHNDDGHFLLNGILNIGVSYDNRGIAADRINNGTMAVTELEVYKLTDA